VIPGDGSKLAKSTFMIEMAEEFGASFELGLQILSDFDDGEWRTLKAVCH